jgi:CDP-glucose 4,6-dehydratase
VGIEGAVGGLGTGARVTNALAPYRGRRVLVTGHTGFKGAWLAQWLDELGAHVSGFSLAPPTTPSLFDAAHVQTRLEHCEGDVRDRTRFEAVIRRVKPDVIFHLAAQSLVRSSYREPLETIQTNVIGTANLLESIRVIGLPVAAVVVTSDKCYEPRRGAAAYREGDPLGGHDVYSASKAAAEIVVSSYQRSFFPPGDIAAHGVGVATVRAGNVVGGGDWAADRLVPDAMRSLSAGVSIAVRRPQAVRPWQHVLDPLAGYLMLGAELLADDPARRAGAAQAWNFGPDARDSRTVAEVVDAIVAAYGRGAWHATGDAGPHEAEQLRVDSAKARQHLGWTPRWDFQRAIEATVMWYRAYEVGEPARDLCTRQIADYVTVACS